MKTIKTQVLPSNVFFNPNTKFLNWAKKNLKGHLLIDCGAGVGRLTRELKDLKLSVLAIDLCERSETEVIVLNKDSRTFEFPKSSVAIIARPCRGDWIHETIYHALETCSYVLYIGIEEHIEEDIEALKDLTITEVMKCAGDDNEIVYRLSKEEITKKTTYHLVQTTLHFANPDCKDMVRAFWYEDDGDRWRNFNGGWMPKSDDDKTLETVEADDIRDLDWSKTSLIDNRNKSGWLDREGKFWGCNSQAHDLIADLVFKKTVEEMEKQGMVRIYDSETWACMIPMSPEQRNYMSFNGYKITEID